MKTILICAASALALAAAGAANAAELNDGYVGLNYASTDFGGLLNGFDADLTSLRAVGSWNLNDTYELQVDGDVTKVDFGPLDTTIWGPTVHLFADGGNYKAGVFVGYQDAENTDLLGGGVETRFFPSDDWSVGGSVAWGSMEVGPVDVDLTTIRGEASYFVNDNFRLDAHASTTNLQVIILGTDIKTYGVGGEYKLAAQPVSFTFGYERSDTSSLINIDADTYSLGLRYVFGGNLRARDRNSSPFNGISTSLGGNVQQSLVGLVGAIDLDDLEDFEDACEIFGECDVE